MTLLYTSICDVNDCDAAVEAGADRTYMRLGPGLDLPPGKNSFGCLLAVDLGPQTNLSLSFPRQDWPENLIGIISAPDQDLASSLAANGFKSLLLATGTDRLLKVYEPEILQHFISSCHTQGLELGFGGQIESPDIPRLLLLEPDFLVFPSDPGLHAKTSPELNKTAIAMARDLIESFEAGSNRALASAGDAGATKKPQSRRDSSIANTERSETDLLFVHDLILPASIGAYKSETNAPQRIRVNVDLAIRRQISRGHDMRDIFSYDLIVDTIKLILGRGHIQFIETLAEEVASAMLAHPRISSAKVRVEKLDILQASAGIEIFREKLSESAAITQLFLEPEIKLSGR